MSKLIQAFQTHLSKIWWGLFLTLNKDKFTNHDSFLWWFERNSALSTFDGKVEAYHGYDG